MKTHAIICTAVALACMTEVRADWLQAAPVIIEAPAAAQAASSMPLTLEVAQPSAEQLYRPPSALLAAEKKKSSNLENQGLGITLVLLVLVAGGAGYCFRKLTA